MKLKHLHIDSYHIFRDFDIDFCVDSSPADIIVIAGVNGTGKTTLLRDVLADQGMSETVTDIGSVGVVTSEYPEGVSMKVSMFNEKYGDDIQYFPASQIDTYTLTEYVSGYVNKLVFEEGRTGFEAYHMIQEMIDVIFKDFQLGTRFVGMTRDRELIFANSRGEKFDVEGLSDGEKQILSKVFPLFTDEMRGKLILMDEPEESLHPSWQMSLVSVLRRCAKENDCQFILATHSPQIISSVRSEELRMLVRTGEGDIKAERCTEGPYGWTVEKVLHEIQHVNFYRVPEVEEKLRELTDMIERNEYGTDSFKALWEEMELTLGYSDSDLVLMRMEMLRKRKNA